MRAPDSCDSGRMAQAPQARWWEIRRAQNLKPVSYRCPLCHRQLPALSEHVLMLPEGKPAGRRHAHTDCVMAARKVGTLPTRAEWRASQRPGSPTGVWGRLRARLSRHSTHDARDPDSEPGG
jgi:hypothetical protein